MEKLNNDLLELLKEELYSLNTGHSFNRKRLKTMHDICHLLTYYNYVELSDYDILKMIRFYEY